jgi:hypothetical protein
VRRLDPPKGLISGMEISKLLGQLGVVACICNPST